MENTKGIQWVLDYMEIQPNGYVKHCVKTTTNAEKAREELENNPNVLMLEIVELAEYYDLDQSEK
jgi:hypothetical protein